MKPIEHQFRDWEGVTFGYGYGTGEEHTIPVLKRFLELCNITHGNDSIAAYDYKILERELTPVVAWVLISILCRANMIEYGTSPRFGWLTVTGRRLKDFVSKYTADELYDFACDCDESYSHCYPNACNCSERGYEKGRVCQNQFWLDNYNPLTPIE